MLPGDTGYMAPWAGGGDYNEVAMLFNAVSAHTNEADATAYIDYLASLDPHFYGVPTPAQVAAGKADVASFFDGAIDRVDIYAQAMRDMPPGIPGFNLTPYEFGEYQTRYLGYSAPVVDAPPTAPPLGGPPIIGITPLSTPGTTLPPAPVVVPTTGPLPPIPIGTPTPAPPTLLGGMSSTTLLLIAAVGLYLFTRK